MPIPNYQDLFLPIMEMASDERTHTLKEAYELLSNLYQLTDEERQRLIPSGRTTYIKNRIGWARTYLARAGLLEGKERGTFIITERGKHVLKSKPAKLDVRFLNQYPEFKAFHVGKSAVSEETSNTSAEEDAELSVRTPDELMDEAYKQARSVLASTLVERIKAAQPVFFERLVVKLLLKMGYGQFRDEAGIVTNLSHDGGIDGIITEDKLGLESIYVQAKKWEGKVGRVPVQQFAGALQQHNARKGVFLTTSDFTADAKDFVSKIPARIVLLSGLEVAQLMIDHNVGVTTKASYELKEMDSDFFDEDWDLN